MITTLGSLTGLGAIAGIFSGSDPLYSFLPKLAIVLGTICLVSFVSSRILRSTIWK